MLRARGDRATGGRGARPRPHRCCSRLRSAVRRRGVAATRDSPAELMAAMEPAILFGSQEQSVRQRRAVAAPSLARQLGTGAGARGVSRRCPTRRPAPHDGMGRRRRRQLARELVETGLATADPYHHLSFQPRALSPLRERLERRKPRFRRELGGDDAGYVGFLDRHSINAQLAATMIRMDCPTPCSISSSRRATPSKEHDLTASLTACCKGRQSPAARAGGTRARRGGESALNAGAPGITRYSQRQAIASINNCRRAVARCAGRRESPCGARACAAVRTRIRRRRLRSGRGLLAPGPHLTNGRRRRTCPALDRGRQRFEAFVQLRPAPARNTWPPPASRSRAIASSILVASTRRFRPTRSIRRAERLDDARQVAVGKGQLRHRSPRSAPLREALAAYTEARERFTALGERAASP